jgi:hypothetical protein
MEAIFSAWSVSSYLRRMNGKISSIVGYKAHVQLMTIIGPWINGGLDLKLSSSRVRYESCAAVTEARCQQQGCIRGGGGVESDGIVARGTPV